MDIISELFGLLWIEKTCGERVEVLGENRTKCIIEHDGRIGIENSFIKFSLVI